ncbi:MAG: hypothetical protein NTX14_02130 [Candidatus Nealsonbacteria bacterium]|nr:hypothetical protein [Candidatus Nealsonbacteria bacterium]
MTSYSHPSTPFLKYGIREIVDVAGKLKALDPTYDFVWENIGDPIAKGWPVPPFLKDIKRRDRPARRRGFWLFALARRNRYAKMGRGLRQTLFAVFKA